MGDYKSGKGWTEKLVKSLKPCAHCGRAPTALEDPHGFEVECSSWKMMQDDCSIRTRNYDTPEEAAQVWNRRAITIIQPLRLSSGSGEPIPGSRIVVGPIDPELLGRVADRLSSRDIDVLNTFHAASFTHARLKFMFKGEFIDGRVSDVNYMAYENKLGVRLTMSRTGISEMGVIDIDDPSLVEFIIQK